MTPTSLLARAFSAGLLLCALAPARAQAPRTKAVAPAAAAQTSQIAATVDPRARRLLDAMTRAYHDVRRLEQTTTYGSGAAGKDGGPNGLIRARLLVERPNRIVLDLVQQPAGSPKPLLTRIQSDGKELYSYREINGWYTRDRAPKSLADLDYLAFSLEMSALTGGDPVRRLLSEARTVSVDGSTVVDGAEADVVALEIGSASGEGVVRLAIGREDHLLRRFEMETSPPKRAAAAAPAQPEGPLAGLVPDEPPPPSEPTRLVYENHVTANPKLAKDAFAWVAPVGSYQYQPYPSFLNPNAGAVQPGKGATAASAAGMPPGITPRKIISFQDLMKNARKPGQKK